MRETLYVIGLLANHLDAMNHSESLLRMFVLDVLRHDEAENIHSIVNMLNDYHTVGWRDHWPREFSQNDVLTVLPSLLIEELIWIGEYNSSEDAIVQSHRAFPLPSSVNLEEIWFGLTSKGRMAIESWKPPQ